MKEASSEYSSRQKFDSMKADVCGRCLEMSERTWDSNVCKMQRHSSYSRRQIRHRTGLTLDWRSWRGQKVTMLVFMMVLSLSSASLDSSCQVGDLQDGYLPSDERQENMYTPHAAIRTVQDCVTECCDLPDCDIAWMVEGNCFSVSCTDKSTCESRESERYQDSTMVHISHSSESGKDCIPGFDDCGFNEVCSQVDGNSAFFCHCRQGYTRHTMGNCYQEPGPPGRMTTQAIAGADYRVCSSDFDCEVDEYCFGVETFGEGICAPDALRTVDTETPTQTPVSKSTAMKTDISMLSPTSEIKEEETGSDLFTSSFVDMPEKKGGPGAENATESVVPEGDDEGAGNSSNVVQLTVSLGDAKTLQLPDEDTVELQAYVLPAAPESQAYMYEYHVVTEPDDSNVQMTSKGQEDPQVDFSDLSAGFYQFKVAVVGYRASGTATVNVTVLAPPRVNQAPVAIIQPDTQVVTLPNSDTILDGSQSTDDDANRINTYSWEQVQGPIGDHEISGDEDTLQLTDLKPGEYHIRLTVTDYDGESNSTIAIVTVMEEEDYKPNANAGPDVEIKLPVNFAILNGSGSTDDHGIASYEWTKITDNIADITGSSSKILHLTNLEEGTYRFQLTVTDRKEQKDTDFATVIVKPEQNLPPTADGGPDKELSLPTDATELDGSGSKDDLGITSYHWEQVSGPSDADLTDPDQAKVSVSQLKQGTYVFRLTVMDASGEKANALVSVTVKGEAKNSPPVANAGPDQLLTLPSVSLELDGTGSHDDREIVSFLWTRSKSSPASGVVVGNSDHLPILRMVDLVPGDYDFTLNVTDAQGKYGTDTVKVTVKQDPNVLSLVQIIFEQKIVDFTQQDKNDLVFPLAVLLGVNNDDVILQRISETDTSMLKVEFYALNKTTKLPMPGPEVLKRLKSKGITSQKGLLEYNVLEYDTIVCQKNCSGHGSCDPYTKRCVCETFWMENIFKVKFGDGESNCDWSILYVIIISFLSVVGLGIFIWLVYCCCKRRKKKGKRRHRYTLLEDQDVHEDMEMLPKMGNGKQSSSIMISESGDDSDEENTVFDIKREDRNGSKPVNGFVTGKHRSTRTPHRTDKI